MAITEETFRHAVALPPDVCAGLTERLIANLAEDISPKITNAWLAEVHLRIASVESGEAAPIPGDETLACENSLLSPYHRGSGWLLGHCLS